MIGSLDRRVEDDDDDHVQSDDRFLAAPVRVSVD